MCSPLRGNLDLDRTRSLLCFRLMYDELYSDDVVLLDSGVACPALFIYLYVFLSCRVMLYIPVVENPAVTGVRVT